MNLKNKVVLVTGGAVRVGRAIVLELIQKGALVCCHYHSSEEPARRLVQLSAQFDGQVHLFKANLSSVKAAEQLVQNVLAECGRIDVLVNNAAVFFKTPFGQVREADWDRIFQINLKSVFFLAQKVGLQMQEQKAGKIINIADSGAIHPFPSYLPYSISKAGVMALTIGLAKALAPHVQVNCVNPGPVLIPEDFPEKEKQFAIEQTLLKKEGNAEDIARMVRFLIEEGDYMTGTCINVDGGRAIR